MTFKRKLLQAIAATTFSGLTGAAQAHFQMLYLEETALQRAEKLEFALVFTHPFSGGPKVLGVSHPTTAQALDAHPEQLQVQDQVLDHVVGAGVAAGVVAFVFAFVGVVLFPAPPDSVLHCWPFGLAFTYSSTALATWPSALRFSQNTTCSRLMSILSSGP